MPPAIKTQLPSGPLRKITEERDRDDEALNSQLMQLEHSDRSDRLRHSRDSNASRGEKEEVEDDGDISDDEATADNGVRTPERTPDEG